MMQDDANIVEFQCCIEGIIDWYLYDMGFEGARCVTETQYAELKIKASVEYHDAIIKMPSFFVLRDDVNEYVERLKKETIRWLKELKNE